MENQEVNGTKKTTSSWESDLETIRERSNYGYKRTRVELHYGPPKDWTGLPPAGNAEIFIGNLTKETTLPDLVNLIDNEVGQDKTYEICLMLDHMGGESKGVPKTRGYAFATFKEADSTAECLKKLNGIDFNGKKLKVNASQSNICLFIANIPKHKSKDDILKDLREYTEGIKELQIFPSKNEDGEADAKHHRGFAFVDFDSWNLANSARRKLTKPGFRLWNRELKVDWALKKQEPNDQVMSRVKTLFIKNLNAEATEDKVKDVIMQITDKVEKVRRLRDFAFVHFKDKQEASDVMNELKDKLSRYFPADLVTSGVAGDVEVDWARPQNPHPNQHPGQFGYNHYGGFPHEKANRNMWYGGMRPGGGQNQGYYGGGMPMNYQRMGLYDWGGAANVGPGGYPAMMGAYGGGPAPRRPPNMAGPKGAPLRMKSGGLSKFPAPQPAANTSRGRPNSSYDDFYLNYGKGMANGMTPAGDSCVPDFSGGATGTMPGFMPVGARSGMPMNSGNMMRGYYEDWYGDSPYLGY